MPPSWRCNPFSLHHLALPFSLLLFSWTLSSRPPVEPDDPVDVVLVDYGYHASIILPRGPNSSVEYAYGDWDYFALSNNHWINIIPALSWPTQGTLGRREIPVSTDPNSIQPHLWSDLSYRLTVDHEDVAELLGMLDGRFKAGAETKIDNAQHRMTFVQDSQDYCLFWNCNQETAAWLETLGCSLRGSRFFASFD